ncbi:MAG: sugar phosphate isomerase/epimerase family protein [Pirellulaceae bacterium]
MIRHMTRRDFLAATAAAGTALTLARPSGAAPFKTNLKKALIGKPTEEVLTRWKAAGFEGLEVRQWDVRPDEAAKARGIAESLGMRIHSVMRAWVNFNDPNSVEKDIATVETALKAAEGYGADAILLVPCKVRTKMAIPQPWEFDIEFDEKTGHLKQVVAGDNSPYAEYIAIHDASTDATRNAVRKLIPVAEKTGVVIALENVWNDLWVKPAIFKHLVASFQCPWAQAYFDIGNHVKYAPPEAWIRALDQLIVKCHIKDFQLNADGHGGKFCDIRDGSIRWPSVRKCLDEIGYNGWMTIEGSGRLSLEERNKRLDLIVAGK